MYLIAEIGVNHDGSLEKAYELIDAAKHSGADCVKFQHFSAVRLVSPELERYELGIEGIAETKAMAESLGIDWLCTPFGLRELHDLVDIGADAIKLSSREVANHAMLTAAMLTGLDLYVSLGMSTHDEQEAAIDELSPAAHRTCLMHCVTGYPVPITQAGVSMVSDLIGRGFTVGYSDHTIGTTAAACAVALGATVIEKHFTLNHSDEGPDHHMSASPSDFVALADAVHEAHLAMGCSSMRHVMPVEEEYRRRFR